MELLNDVQVERIYRVTDDLRLHRDWVVVPLDAAAEPVETVMVDGKLLIHAPAGAGFDAWLDGLRERLEALELHRVPRSHERDPKWPLTGPGEIRFEGTSHYHPRGHPAWKP